MNQTAEMFTVILLLIISTSQLFHGGKFNISCISKYRWALTYFFEKGANGCQLPLRDMVSAQQARTMVIFYEFHYFFTTQDYRSGIQYKVDDCDSYAYSLESIVVYMLCCFFSVVLELHFCWLL